MTEKNTDTPIADLALESALVIEAEGHVWAVRPELLAVIRDLHGRVASDMVLTQLQEAQSLSTSRSKAQVASGVAVLPLKGMLTPTPSLLALLFGGGGSGLIGFRSQLKAAAADPEVKSIVLDVDSPGGYVDLIPEIAADIRKAGDQKPIVAVANTMAASAAYWLASQAHEVVVSPSAEVGSIGVYQIHMDKSGALEQAGFSPTIIKAGKYKIESNPYQPLTADGIAQMQESVDDYYGMFTSDVAAGRGVPVEDVQAGYGEGRVLTAKRAKSAGLADRVATLDETVARLSSGRARVRRASDDVELAVSEWAPKESGGEEERETVSLADLTPEERGLLFDVVAG